MRFILLILALITIGLTSKSQTNDLPRFHDVDLLDTSRYEAKYLHIHTDPLDNSKERIGLQMLLIGPKYSVWESYGKYKGDSLANESKRKTITRNEYTEKRRVSLDGTNLRLLRCHEKEDSLWGEEFFLTLYPDVNIAQPQFNSAAPEIEWTIDTVHKKIHGIETTKATGKVYGREWTVWFAESIPYFEGPWELTNAPGLILEAYDDSGEHQFTLEEAGPIKKPIVFPSIKGKVMSRDEFRKYRKEHFAAEIAKKKRSQAGPDTFDNFLDLE